jgi:quercetin dioxygenase-like cupin family protein
MKKNVNLKLLAIGVSLLFAACNGDETKTTDTATDSTTNKMAATDSASNKQSMDAVTVAPGRYNAIADSAGIRVLEVSYKPGDSSAMHSHPDNVLYVVEPGKTEFTMQDGSKHVYELKAGDAMVLPAETHSVKNIGSTTTHSVLVEVNRPNNAAPAIAADMDPMKVSADMHKLIKDTLNIRAMIFTAKPGQSTAKHSHPDHAIYVIQGGKGEFTAQDGTKQVKELQKGMALINPATTHSFKNVGTSTIKVLVVEVKRAAQ